MCDDGACAPLSEFDFGGSISDVAFFPEALSDAQILQLDPSWEIQQTVPTLEADGSAVVVNSDVAVPDGTYLMARVRLIDERSA